MPAPAIAIARKEPPRLRSVTTRSGSSGWATRRWSATNATSRTRAGGEERDRQRDRPSRRSRRGRSRRRARTGRTEASSVPGMSSRGRAATGTWCSRRQRRRSRPGRRRAIDTYRHQRQSSTSVSTPPSSRPTRAAGAGDRAEDAERLGALGGLGERRGQQRERGGREQRAEHALQGAGADEQAEALRGAAERGCAGEAEQAGDEGPLAAEQVADAAAEQQQAAEGQRVGRDDPLAVVVGEAEVLLRGGQRDVHDRHVEHDHQLGDADDREDQPAAVVMGIGHGEDLRNVESRVSGYGSTSGDVISTL